MPTIKQQKLAKNLTGNYASYADALRDAGYSESTAMQPGKIIPRAGVQQTKEEFIAKGEELGITDDLLIKKIREAIIAMPPDIALDNVWKWIKLKHPDNKNGLDRLGENVQINIQTTPESVEKGVYMWIKNNPTKHEEIRRLLQ